MTGIDPFADDLDDRRSVDAAVRAYAACKASPLKVADLDYLLRHEDATGKLDPSEADLLRDLLAPRQAHGGRRRPRRPAGDR